MAFASLEITEFFLQTTANVPSATCGQYMNSTGFIDTWFDTLEVKAIVYSTLASGTISLVGSLYMIITFFCFPKVWRKRNNFGMKLVMIIINVNCMESISFIWGAIVQMGRMQQIDICDSFVWKCEAQAVLTNYAQVSCYCWMVCLATFLFLTLVGRTNQSRFQGWGERWFHAVSWGIPLVCVVVGVIEKVYGPSGQWCGINEWTVVDRQIRTSEMEILVYKILLDGLWLGVAIVWNIIVLFCSVRSIKRLVQDGHVSNKPSNDIKFTLYLTVFVFLLTHAFSIVNRCWTLFSLRGPGYTESAYQFSLYLLQSIFEPLQGFGFALLYGCNPIVRRGYRAKCCPRERARSGDADPILSANTLEESLLSSATAITDSATTGPINWATTVGGMEQDGNDAEDMNYNNCGSYDTPFSPEVELSESPITYEQVLIEEPDEGPFTLQR